MPATEVLPGLLVRGFAPPLALADYKLIAFDMDSTLISIECIDEIARLAAAGLPGATASSSVLQLAGPDRKQQIRVLGQVLAAR